MKAEKIKNRISEICSHFTFIYQGKDCGVDPFSHNHFDMWFGDTDKTVNNIDDVMNSPFFDGKSLSEICEDIEVIDF